MNESGSMDMTELLITLSGAVGFYLVGIALAWTVDEAIERFSQERE